jgi:hypothetical protein
MGLPKVLNTDNVLRPKPTVSRPPTRSREQTPSILLGQREPSPKGSVLLSQLHRLHGVACPRIIINE